MKRAPAKHSTLDLATELSTRIGEGITFFEGWEDLPLQSMRLNHLVVFAEMRLRDLDAGLRKYRWRADIDGRRYCSDCGAWEANGCAPNCRLAALLEGGS